MPDTASSPAPDDTAAAHSPFARFGRLVRHGMVLFWLFIALIGTLIVHQWWVQHQTTLLTTQSGKALQEIAQVRVRLSDLYAGMNLFAHTQNPDLLGEKVACGALCEHLPRLSRHVNDTPEMRIALQRARVWDARLADSLQSALLAAQRGAPTREVEELLAQAREIELPQLRHKIDEISTTEALLLGERQALAAAATQQLLLAVWLMTLVATGAALWLYRQAMSTVQAGLDIERQAQEQVFEDPLTGLPNRRLLAESTPLLLHRARRQQQTVALMRVGLNDFQPLLARHGPLAGDMVLRSVADRMRCTLRDSDLLARLEGDDFAVLLDGSSNASEVLRVGQRLVEAVAEPVPLPGGAQAMVSLSIGLACFPADGQQLDGLLRAAEDARLAARLAGENRLCRAGREPVTHVLSPSTPLERIMADALSQQPA